LVLALNFERKIKMKYLIVMVILCYSFVAQAEWVCWVTGKECGTYSWNENKDKARFYALKKCVEECGGKCKVDYCEKLKGKVAKK